ncbi:MAG: VOC family protein [Candidatus Diapherotrites archaeon]|nr:VOC family protein [Candidatus Diapherotrites archaeon]
MKFNSMIPELSVSNPEKSLNFYTKILGFKIEYQRKEEGFSFISLEKVQLMIDAIGKGNTWKTGKFDYPLGRGINFQIQVHKIAPLLKNLKKYKVKLFAEPEEKWYKVKNSEFGNRQFLVQDPDGYLLRFFEDMGKKPVRGR